MGVGGQRHLRAVLLTGKDQHPLYRRLGGPQGWYGVVWKISPPLGFDPRTVQPTVSHYTDRDRFYCTVYIFVITLWLKHFSSLSSICIYWLMLMMFIVDAAVGVAVYVHLAVCIAV